MDLTAGGTFKMDLGAATTAGTTYDQLALTGVLTGSTLAGDIKFEFNGLAGIQTSTTYTLMTFGSSSNFTVADLSATILPSGLSLNSTFGTDGWNITGTELQVQFIPEPSAFAMILGGVGTLILLRRRRSS